jgi:hypothetical protein
VAYADWRRNEQGEAQEGLPIAQAVADQGEQLAGGGDLGDVFGLFAEPGDDRGLNYPG